MKKKTKKRVYRREWLEPKFVSNNEAPADSYLVYDIVDIGSNYQCASVKIADCSRSVTMFFDGEHGGVAKIDNLIALLQEFRTNLAEVNSRRKSSHE